MKSKHFLILIGICLLLAGAAFFLSQSDEAARSAKPGGPVLPDLKADLDANKIAGIAVIGPEQSVRLRRGESGWTVDERHGFPARFTSIADLVEKLEKLSVGRRFTAKPDVLDRLALNDPLGADGREDKGLLARRVRLFDASDGVLADLLIGNRREGQAGSGGQYMRLFNADSVILADEAIFGPETDPARWIETEILNVREADLQGMSCIDPSGKILYAVTPGKEGDSPALESVAEGETADEEKVAKVFGALSDLSIEDVLDPAAAIPATAFEKAPRFEYHLADGTVWAAVPGAATPEDGNRFYFRISAARPEGAAPPEGVAGRTDLSSWTFVITKWHRDAFAPDRASLLQKPEEKPES